MSEDLKARLGGLLLLAIGLGVGWYFVLGPYRAALEGASQVSYSIKAFILVPFALAFGLAFLFMGSGLKYRNDDHKNLTPVGWILMGVAGIAAFAGFFWFQGQFTALGYV